MSDGTSIESKLLTHCEATGIYCQRQRGSLLTDSDAPFTYSGSTIPLGARRSPVRSAESKPIQIMNRPGRPAKAACRSWYRATYHLEGIHPKSSGRPALHTRVELIAGLNPTFSSWLERDHGSSHTA